MNEMEQEKRVSLNADVMLRRALDLRAKNNVLIAEFMGIVFPKLDNVIVIDNVVTKEDELQYHTSWDWLMPVVERIESDERYDVDILQYGTRIIERTKTESIEIVNNIANMSFDKKIEHTYQAVVEFINQLNK